jgi:hypothetical protein
MSDTELNKTLGVLASGAAKRPEGRCPGQEASVKKYDLAEVEAGKRGQPRCSAQEGNLALFPDSLESEQNRLTSSNSMVSTAHAE